jgi:hypothetical protein
MKEICCFRRRTNGTQKIFLIKNQSVTIPVPGTKAPDDRRGPLHFEAGELPRLSAAQTNQKQAIKGNSTQVVYTKALQEKATI